MADQNHAVQAMPASRPPPGVSTGPLAWAKANLFSGVISTIVTLLLAYLIVSLVWTLLDWLVFNGIWARGPENNPAEPCRQTYGFCYAYLETNWSAILFGVYPGEERWRPGIAVVLILGLIVLSALPRFWSRKLILAWYIAAVAAAILMYGGEISWATVFWIVMIGAPIIRLLMPRTRINSNPVAFGLSGFALVWIALALIQIVLSTLGLSPLSTGGIDTGLEHVGNRSWGGLPITLGLALIGCGVAFPIGIVLALGRRSQMPAIRFVCVIYIEFIRGVPLITILFMATFLFPLFMPEGVNIDNLLRAQVGMILFAAAYLAEVVRGGLQAIPKGQFEAAQSMGLTYWQSMRLIILPQALKISIPPLVNTFIGFYKDTTLVLIIGIYDLLASARATTTDSAWQGFYPEAYAVVAVIYFITCFGMSKYSQWIERRTDTTHRR
ncbi:MAG: amino acid ABC transporter permease [Pseudomonadota bacterium]